MVSDTANFDELLGAGFTNSGINKGAAAVGCVASVEPDLIFAAGDDQTDEDLFRALPRSAFTVRVGIPHSRATYQLKDHLEVRELLSALLERTA